MQHGSGVTNLQTELNYLDSFKSYCNSSDFSFLGSGGLGQVGGGCLGWSAIVYMTSGMFRGKESSKQNQIISISSRLIEFCGSGGGGGGWMLWGVVGGWGVGGGVGGCRVVGGWLGGAPHTCTHACACIHTHTW